MNFNERLRAAAKAGSEPDLKALLREPGCNALSRCAEEGMTALMWAVAYGHEGCVGTLLPASDALSTDKHGGTALMYAAYHGHEGCVRILLPASDALAQDKDRRTALMWA